MGYFLTKEFVKKERKKLTLTVVYKYNYDTYTQSFTFPITEKGFGRARCKLYKILDIAYMDLESNEDGKIETDNGKYIFIKAKDVREFYDYDMVWKDLKCTGTTEDIEYEDGTLSIYMQ